MAWSGWTTWRAAVRVAEGHDEPNLPETRRRRSGVTAWSPDQRDAVRAAVVAFTLSRGVLLAVTLAVALAWRRSPAAVWNQWDSVWYLGIATHGYTWSAPGHEATSYPGASLAFFPLFPVLIHCLTLWGLPAIAAGLLIANGAFLAALVYVYKLVVPRYGEQAGRRSLLLFALFPTAFFTFAPYTESLFLAAAAGALYHAYRGQPLRSGIWLTVALLTRSTGVILLLPAALLLRPGGAREWLSFLGPSAGGWLIYLLYLSARHIPVAWVFASQRAWHRGLSFPWSGFWGSVQWIAHHGSAHPLMAADTAFSVAVTVAFLALTLLAWPDAGVPVRLYYAGFWLLILLSPQWLDDYYAPFGSVDRFVLVLFPLAGWAAVRLARRGLRAALAVSTFGLAAMSALHTSGVWLG